VNSIQLLYDAYSDTLQQGSIGVRESGFVLYFNLFQNKSEVLYFCLLLIFIIFSLFSILRFNNHILNLIIFVSTISNSFILFGKYPIFDEILAIWSLLIFALAFFFRKNYRTFSLKSFLKHESILLLYLLTNTIISLLINEQINFSNLRFVNIYIILLLIIFISTYFIHFTAETILFFKIGVLIYLYLWTFYWIALKMLSIDWNLQQSVIWSGSVGASFIPAFASIFVLKDFFAKSPIKKSLAIPSQIILLSSLNSFLYESRILQAICFFVITLLVFATFRYKALFLSLFLIFALLLPTALNFNGIKVNGIKTITLNWYKNQINSSLFLINTKKEDGDRERQLQCINSVILQNENFAKVLFGYGQNNHKSILFDCKEIKDTLRSDLEYVRPVGLTSFVVDFGLVGLILLIGVFLKKILILFLNRDFISILALTILPIYLLLTNAWDIIIFNVILFTDFLFKKAKFISSQDAKMK
jgi:hypothetical protein